MEVLNFLGGLLALLAVLIPIIRNAYRRAKRRGTQRFLILQLLAITNLVIWVMGGIIWLFSWNPVFGLSCFAISLILVILNFALSAGLPSRADILLLLSGVFASFFLIGMELYQIDRIAAAKQPQQPTPTPTPAIKQS
jgi:bacteriorhodopsin